MARILWAALLALLLCATQAGAQISENIGTMHNSPVGFVRAHWISTIDRMVVDPLQATDNSVPGLNPATGTWIELFQNDAPTFGAGIVGRDNEGSFFVAARNELWVWGGSHMESFTDQNAGVTGTILSGPTNGRFEVDWPTGYDGWVETGCVTDNGNGTVTTNSTCVIRDGATSFNYAGPIYQSGRLSFAGCVGNVIAGCATWAERNKDFANVDNAGTIIKNNVNFFGGAGMGCAWSAAADGGICAFGEAGTQNHWMVVEPNNGSSICTNANSGGQPYIQCNTSTSSGDGSMTSIPSTRPPNREQCQNCLVAVGSDIYVYGGSWNAPAEGRLDLWKYNLATHVWTQLADSPARDNVQTTIVYDSTSDKLLVWVKISGVSALFVYHLSGPSAGTWENKTPTGMACASNNVGVYAPTFKAGIWGGGNDCIGGQNDAVTAIPYDASCVNGLCLRHRTFTRRALPTDAGPCLVAGGCKQWSVRFRSANNNMYFWGGDNNVAPPNGPLGAAFSADLLTNSWTREHDRCPTSPDIIPRYPTEDSWAYDSLRDRMYWMGGGHFNENETSPCPDETLLKQPAMTFNPNTSKWSQSSWPDQITGGGSSTGSQVADYDPVTDTVLQPAECCGGFGFTRFNVGTETWSSVGLPCSDNVGPGIQGPCGSGQTYTNSGWSRVGPINNAIDPVGRFFYTLESPDAGENRRMLRYNIDAASVTVMPALPTGGVGHEMTFDTANNLVYWWTNGEAADSVLNIYHPDAGTGDAGTWETDSTLYQPQGSQARGNSIGFDKYHNALLLMGGAFPEHSVCPECSFYSYYFLYRYAANENPQATISVASSGAISCSVTVTPADVNGSSNGTTNFARTYNIGDTITASIVASSTCGSNYFVNWTGCDSASTVTCTMAADDNATVTANYTSSGSTTAKLGGGTKIGSSAKFGM